MCNVRMRTLMPVPKYLAVKEIKWFKQNFDIAVQLRLLLKDCVTVQIDMIETRSNMCKNKYNPMKH